uniref:Uncharacterized protein n=1 Tax=Anas platyrhynchos platyrhynchos TaxID=8840 RepID=A0A493TTL1_ANAPP
SPQAPRFCSLPSPHSSAFHCTAMDKIGPVGPGLVGPGNPKSLTRLKGQSLLMVPWSRRCPRHLISSTLCTQVPGH